MGGMLQSFRVVRRGISASAALARMPVVVAAAGLGGVACRHGATPPDPEPVVVEWYHPDQRSATNAPYVDSELAVFGTLRSPAVVALDATTGALRWGTSLQVSGLPSVPIPFDGSPVGHGGLIIVPAGDVFALDRTTGHVAWIFTRPDDLPGSGKLLVEGGTVYAVGKRLYALDAATGALKWSRDLDDRAASPVAAGGGGIIVLSRALVAGTDVLGVGHVHLIDAFTGATRWSIPVGASGAPVSGPTAIPAVDSGLVLVTTADGRVIAISVATGSQVWTRDLANRLDGGVIAMNGLAIAGGISGRLEAFNLTDGDPRWSKVFGTGGSIVNRIGRADTLALVVSGRLEAYSRLGEVVWAHGGVGFGQPVYDTPAIEQNGLIYVGGESGFYALKVRKP